VPRCSVSQPTFTLIREITGGMVAHRDRTTPRILRVRRTFEPSRVAPACVVDAYERVVPVARRTVRTDRAHEQLSQTRTKYRRSR
jgi:hypothetical protein